MSTWVTTVSEYPRYTFLRTSPLTLTSGLQKITLWNYCLYSVRKCLFWWIGIRLVSQERKEKRHSQESLEYTEELHAETLMKKSEISHRSQEPNNLRVWAEGWSCRLDHAGISQLILGKYVYRLRRRVLSPVFTHRSFLIDGNHYHPLNEQLLINHRQKTPALSSRKIQEQDRLL